MVYALLRPVARIALRLFYRDIEVVGLDRVPTSGPVILVVNHPNALVDALVVCTVVSRRVHLTAKATLFDHPMANWFFRSAGVIPLRRIKDESPGGAAVANRDRNAEAFQAIHETLQANGAVLIFPEGITHDAPALAPLRTGAARLALQARDELGVRGLAIVPIGLTFTKKEAARSRVLVEVGDPIALDDWPGAAADGGASALTADITSRLRAVTLNFASLDDAEQAASLARMLARLLVSEAPSLDRGGPTLSTSTTIVRRIEQLRTRLPNADPLLRARVYAYVEELRAFESTLRELGLSPDDLIINRDVASAARFIAREGWILLVGSPIALWGNINHWLPFRVARQIATRSVESAADPAMRTIVAGAALVTVMYVVQGGLVAHFFGWPIAAAYLMSLPLAAEVNFRLRERFRRAIRRARAYLSFRKDPGLHRALTARAERLKAEAVELDRRLSLSELAHDR
jgi:glycerol-3-phosphate O-acyltransferase/dihydroxyacetone phosphate acyltransferase